MGMGMPDELMVLALVVFVLMAVLRWSFGSQNARSERKLARARDYGLLREVATTHSDQAARFVQDLLRRNGIRTTTAPGEEADTVRVLVFPKDARAAADLLLHDPESGES